MVLELSPFCGMHAPGHLPKKRAETLFFEKLFTFEVFKHFECIFQGLNQKRSWPFGVVNDQARASRKFQQKIGKTTSTSLRIY